MPEQAVRQSISREVRRALSDARLTAAAAAARMPGRPDAKLIYRWANAEVTAPLERLQQFALAVDQPLTLRLGPETTKETRPEWAGEMVQAITTTLEDRLRRFEDAIAARVAEETSRLVLQSVARTETGADDPDQTSDPPHAVGQDG